MFFIITHTWEEAKQEEANASITGFYSRAHYGKIGNPWPKLFNSWRDPDSRTMYSLIESSSVAALEEVLNTIENVKSTWVRVFQMYPAYVDTYKYVDLGKKVPWRKPEDKPTMEAKK